MPQYNPPLRDMRFVMHEVLNVTEALRLLPRHAEIDAETIDAVLEEAGKFAAEVVFPLNVSGDAEGCTLDKATHEVRAPQGFKAASPHLGQVDAVGGEGGGFVEVDRDAGPPPDLVARRVG